MSPTEVQAYVEDLAAAFSEDPLITWLAPNDKRRRRFFAALLEGGGPHVRVDADPAGGAVAVWMRKPPPPAPLPDWRDLVTAWRLVLAIGVLRMDRLARLGATLELRHPKVDHDYLLLLGVRPDSRGRRAGSKLLAKGLDRLDSDGRGSFLETANPDNVAFYERHGFVVTESYRPIGGGPVLRSMWRPPRSH